jgi:HAD superfamily hydrolase (TIGR01509 family)
MTFDAVLFDMDGTLLETGNLWDRSSRHALKERNIFLTEEEHKSLASVALHFLLTEKGHSEQEVRAVKAVRDEMMIPLIPEEIQWLPDAEELLKDITQQKGMVTSAPGNMVDAFDATLGFRKYFDAVVHGDQVKPRYKPDPLGLFIACERLKADPAKCVFIGDQRSDIEAAKAAGMTGILLRGPHTPPDLHHEHEFSNHLQIKEFLA